jgi:hypothetical protein
MPLQNAFENLAVESRQQPDPTFAQLYHAIRKPPWYDGLTGSMRISIAPGQTLGTVSTVTTVSTVATVTTVATVSNVTAVAAVTNLAQIGSVPANGLVRAQINAAAALQSAQMFK